ncbi:unnamed protein product [Polarella glacialis]|uniref:Methyltransferase FkbM domain-containing protein n=2 Tax=Polarella glacialis TaxID=89957 RepID=A0A813I531_POLGL|nr:unnamed protein product [Polarella glacialis]
MWLLLGPDQLRAVVWELAAGRPPPGGMVGELVQETYSLFWDLNLSWAEVHRSGWPIFSILSSAAERLRDEGRDPCIPEEQLQPFISAFDDAAAISAHQSTAVLMEAASCPDAVASSLLWLADGQRTTARPQEGNRYHLFTATAPESQPPERDAEELLARAEALLRRHRGWDLLTSRWPVWRTLDRLGSKEVVNVTSGSAWFWMHVFPHRVRSDGLISNRIRATSQGYCLQLFQDEVLRLAAESPRKSLRLVEAGPHIGDCMLWAAAEFGDRFSGVAVEPIFQVVSLFRRSIQTNGFQKLIKLHHAWCGAASSEVAVPAGSGPSTGSAAIAIPAPWIHLDAILDEDVDVLKIHTNGGERAILDGAYNLFAEHKVHVVILHSAEAYQLWPSAVFLLQREYSVTADGRRLTMADEGWLRSRVAEKGGLQLHALRQA